MMRTTKTGFELPRRGWATGPRLSVVVDAWVVSSWVMVVPRGRGCLAMLNDTARGRLCLPLQCPCERSRACIPSSAQPKLGRTNADHRALCARAVPNELLLGTHAGWKGVLVRGCGVRAWGDDRAGP